MGAEGMKASLISREVIADSIELVARGNHFDAIVCLSGCDKTNPGVMMALARLDIPGLALYGGSINPGKLGEKSLTVQDVFEAVGAFSAGKISEKEFMDIENFACPGAGSCGRGVSRTKGIWTQCPLKLPRWVRYQCQLCGTPGLHGSSHGTRDCTRYRYRCRIFIPDHIPERSV